MKRAYWKKLWPALRLLFWLAVLAFMIFVAWPRRARAVEFSDFFDGSSVDPKWTVTNLFGGAGTVTEGGGYLVMSVTSGLDAPSAHQASGLTGAAFDVRLRVHVASPGVGDGFFFVIAPAGTFGVGAANFTAILYMPSLGNVVRQDRVVGMDTNGAAVSVGADFIIRITGDAGGNFVCYVLDGICTGTWTTLSPGTPYTSAARPMDCGMIFLSAGGTPGDMDLDWAVLDSEHTGYPAACALPARLGCLNLMME